MTVHVNKPISSLSCTKLSNYKVHCDASASSGLSSDGQLTYVIHFGDDYLVNAPQGDFEFQNSGKKIIKLEITDEIGNKSQTEVVVDIQPLYTDPKAIFTELVELGRVVNFDASLSLLQDRSVSKYEWDFGDGSKINSTDPKVQHTFQQNSYYTVNLTVTDATGAQATVSRDVYIYDPLVLDPGEQGRVDLLGIDSDNDGIRDDVERWIQFESKDNAAKRKYLRSIALVYEENFRNLDTLSNISNNFSKLNKLEQCVKLVEFNSFKISQINSLFRVAYGNTDDRFLASSKIDSSFAGFAIDPEMPDVDLKTFCEALPQ